MPLAWIQRDNHVWCTTNGQFEITTDEITLTYYVTDKLYCRRAAFHSQKEAQDKAEEWVQKPPSGV